MKLTKFQHACLVLEKENSNLVIDPGELSRDFIMPRHVDGIVITHEHPDHFDEKLIHSILAAHPKATIIAHESISGRFTNFTAVAAKVGEVYTVGAFSLRFFGGVHASIAPTVQTPANLGILVDDRLFYPGDSFVIPENVAVQELALPVSAPWLKISEPMEFLATVRPQLAFPTHDGILSNDGKQIVDRLVGTIAAGQGTQYKRLDGQSIELA